MAQQPFVKLFASITDSTIWREPDGTRIVWITMLSMATGTGRVYASVPGLADRARVSLEACQAALATLMAPDPYSRNPAFEGRRIEAAEGGWRILNHQVFRDGENRERRLESKRRYINARRARERANRTDLTITGENVDTCRPCRQAVDQVPSTVDTGSNPSLRPLSGHSEGGVDGKVDPVDQCRPVYRGVDVDVDTAPESCEKPPSGREAGGVDGKVDQCRRISEAEADLRPGLHLFPAEPIPTSLSNGGSTEGGGLALEKPEPGTAAARRIFDHWRTTWKHPGAALDSRRLACIKRALKLYPEAELLRSISGYLNSPHHRGENDRHTVYDELTLFLRDAAHIDAGLRLASGGPHGNATHDSPSGRRRGTLWRPGDPTGREDGP